MNIIFAKHDGYDKEYIFEVPYGMHPERNDILWVETSKGDTVAVATSDVISGYKEVGAFCQDRQYSIHEIEDLPF